MPQGGKDLAQRAVTPAVQPSASTGTGREGGAGYPWKGLCGLGARVVV